MMVRHIASHTSMKESGPEASAPTPFTGAPLGRKVEKSCPMPPPCCMVSAASRNSRKCPTMSSGMVPITKQLNSVTVRPVPAPGDHPPCRQELEALQGLVEAPRPQVGVAFRRRQGPRHAPPRGVQVGLGGPGSIAKTVFHVPDALGDRGPIHRQNLGGCRSISTRLFCFRSYFRAVWLPRPAVWSLPRYARAGSP